MSKRTKKAVRGGVSKVRGKTAKKSGKKETIKKAVKRTLKPRAVGRPAYWPFMDPPNFATITVWRVLERKDPILMVSHDADDGMWQFLNTSQGRKPDIKDAAIVGLRDMLMLDPSVGVLADLPRGGIAWRTAPGRVWKRKLR